MEPSNPLTQPPQPQSAPETPAVPPANPAPSVPEPQSAQLQSPAMGAVEPPVAASNPLQPAMSPTPASMAPAGQPGPGDQTFVNPSAAIYGAPMQSPSPAMNQQPVSEPPVSSRRFGIPKLGMVGMIIVLVLIVLGAGAAAYFGYYAPNQPDNMWGRSLSNMGKGYDKLASYTETYPTNQGSVATGTFQTTGDFVADGTINAASEASNGGINTNSSLDLSLSTHGVKFSLNAITIKSNTSNPDIYLKVDGLQGLGSLLGGQYAAIGSELNGLNGQWYFIDHSLLDQAESSTSSTSTPSLTKADLQQALNAVGGPTKKYVFTSNPNDMAFVIKQKIGKEKIDGRNTYHYKIGINKPNLKAYDKAVCQNLLPTKLFKLLSAGTKVDAASCSDTSDIDKMKDSSTADVWVDTHTKLIHKVRFSDPRGANVFFFDLNQDYQGGNKIPLSVNFTAHDGGDMSTGVLNITLDNSTHDVSITGSYKATGSTKINGSLNLDMKPSSSPVNITKPAKSQNIMQLLDSLGLGGMIGSSSSGSNAQSLPLQ